ncbi:hypothetical protein F5X98DRAFT_351449 [Xylaria grammica]|nr:hypothetical protein F5X98DRAFT_351449 [Xylaria grammica]
MKSASGTATGLFFILFLFLNMRTGPVCCTTSYSMSSGMRWCAIVLPKYPVGSWSKVRRPALGTRGGPHPPWTLSRRGRSCRMSGEI